MSSVRKISEKWLNAQSSIAILLCLGMFVGLMWARALLSISITLFFVNALHPKTIKSFWKHWKSDFFSIACFLFFGAYFISGLWSSNTGQWSASVMNKLAFAVLPFSFLTLPLNRRYGKKIIVWALLIVHLIVIIYSLISFAVQYDYFVEHYNRSYSLPTTKYNDHIRFSLSLVLTLLVNIYFLFADKKTFSGRWERIFLYFTAIVFVLYIHILASKTGLLTLYIALFSFALYFIFSTKKYRELGIVALISFALLPVLLYLSVPTFKTKVDYVKYEWNKTLSGEELNYNLSDAGRLISYKVAGKVSKEHRWIGTGAGDIKDKMDAVYGKDYPEIPAENRLIPHSQYLFTFVALGLLLSISLVLLCLTLFMGYSRPRFYGLLNGFLLVLAMIAEAMLEVQFGIFIFLFFILFWKNVRLPNSFLSR